MANNNSPLTLCGLESSNLRVLCGDECLDRGLLRGRGGLQVRNLLLEIRPQLLHRRPQRLEFERLRLLLLRLGEDDHSLVLEGFNLRQKGLLLGDEGVDILVCLGELLLELRVALLGRGLRGGGGGAAAAGGRYGSRGDSALLLQRSV